LTAKTPSRTAIGPGAYFTHITDPKFKQNRISVNLIMPLDRETASEYAILPFLLRKGCKSCPDFSRLNARLFELYGAALDADVTKYNGFQILKISIRGIDNRFALQGEDIAAQCAELLCDIVLEPNFDDDGNFPENDIALERQFLIDTIEAEINEKRAYALAQCMSAMCGDEPVSVRRYGYVEKAQAITAKSAADAWRKVIATARIEITFTGPGNPASANALFSRRIGGLKRSPYDFGMIILRDSADTIREVTEEMDLHQCKLVMGFRVAGISTQEKVIAASLFAAMFGGTPFSKLFLNVRERLSLCYYCASRYDVSNRLLFVDSGVELKNAAQTREEILRQLDAIRKSDFTGEDLANTKLFLKNSVMSISDSAGSLETWHLVRTLRGVPGTIEDDCEIIARVTAKDLADIAKSVALDTVYLLSGKEDAPNE
jgi:predicted Zn-dependent peptidase